MTPAQRIWAYAVTGSALLVGGVYGYLDGQQIAAWMGLAAAVFGVAIANVPATPETADETADGDGPPPRHRG